MIQQSTIQFLKALAKHNNRDWFLANKAKYDLAKADYLLFVEFPQIPPHLVRM